MLSIVGEQERPNYRHYSHYLLISIEHVYRPYTIFTVSNRCYVQHALRHAFPLVVAAMTLLA